MSLEVGNRYDEEYYSHLKYKAYMKGMLDLKINNYRQMLSATIENVLREMKSLLMRNSEDNEVRSYGKNLSSSKFLKMPDESLEKFCEMYRKYKVIKIKRDKLMNEKRQEEEKKKSERQKRDQMKYLEEQEQRQRLDLKIKGLSILPLAQQQRERQMIEQEFDKLLNRAKSTSIGIQPKQVSESDEISIDSLDGAEMFFETEIDDMFKNEFEEQGNKLYRQLLRDVNSKKEFIDHEFKDDRAIVGSGYLTDYEMRERLKQLDIHSWKRVKDMKDNDDDEIHCPEVIVDGMGAEDISQGNIGDCWFLSALSVVAFNRPDLIEKLLHSESKKYRDDGLYIVKFYKMGYHKIVYVDDRFPVDNRRRSVFCQLKNDGGITEFWPILLEKAYAKLHGCYDALDMGRPEQGLVDLTGGVAETIDFESDDFKKMINNGSFWEKIVYCVRNKCLLAASSNGHDDTEDNEFGIVQGHAYGVLDIQEIDGVRLIQLRNPWGKKEWTGAWSDFDEENWTENRRRRIANKQLAKGRKTFQIGVDDGAFWMTISDFIANYANLSIVRVYERPEWFTSRVSGKWKGQSAGGRSQCHETYLNNPQFKLIVEKATMAVIYMQQ